MDLQKEREVFEKYCFEVLLMSPSDGHFERELEDPEFYESVDTHRLWKLWQAQAQAIPDGFVVVPKEPTQELLNKMQDFFVGAFENGLTGGQSIHCAYIAMIEAQEQAND